jgi:hypothetical protein
VQRVLGLLFAISVGGDHQRVVLPQWLAVGAPIAAQRPARQWLTRVPLALAEMQHGTRRKMALQPFEQVTGEFALLVGERGVVPLRTVHVVDRDEGRLAAHGQAHVVRLEFGVDLVAEVEHGLPLRFRIGLRDARVFVDARDVHREVEVRFALFGGADHRRGGRGHRGAGERDVAFAGEQARGRIEADPAGAGDVDLGPGMQVGEVVVGAGGAVERLDVGFQLDQVTGGEARGEAEVAQCLHQQPGRVAAGTALEFQGFLRRLHAGFEPHDVADVALHALVDADQHVDGAHFLGQKFLARARQPIIEQRAGGIGFEIGAEFVLELFRVLEGKVLGELVHEEVEGVDHRHVGDQVDRDRKRLGLFREDQSCHPVAEGVLLPVEEVAGRLDLERIAEDGRAAVGRRAQAHLVRPQADRAVEAVAGLVVERDADGHREPFRVR